MCVIAFSPAGVDIPDEATIRQMWASNPDGAGFAYNDKRGVVHYSKGYMHLDDLLKALKKRKRYKDNNFAIHFRIGTSGKNDASTCHPFPISNNFGALRRLRGDATPVLFHNGIIDEGGLSDPLASDTQDLVVALYPMLKDYSKSKTRDHYINKLLDISNKLLVLYSNNRYKMYGQWERDGELYVSNTYYKPRLYGYSNAGGGYGDSWWYNYTHGASVDEATEAKTLWATILRNEYAYLSPRELKLLRDLADYNTKDTLVQGDYVLGVDEVDGLVWVEETPPTTPTTTATTATTTSTTVKEGASMD